MNFVGLSWRSLLDKRVIALIVLVFVFLIAWKVTSINENLDIPDAAGHIAGFWTGLWDGLMSPVSMIKSMGLIDNSVYDTFNTGIAYAFAYLLPVATYGYFLVIAMIYNCNP